MSGRNLPWETEAAIVRDVLRWSDTAAEASPINFSLAIARECDIPDQHPWRASAWFTHPVIDFRVMPGATTCRVGRGATPEKAIVDLAYILHKDFAFCFTAMPEDDNE